MNVRPFNPQRIWRKMAGPFDVARTNSDSSSIGADSRISDSDASTTSIERLTNSRISSSGVVEKVRNDSGPKRSR